MVMKKKQLKLPIIKVSDKQMDLSLLPKNPPKGYRLVKRGLVHKKDYTFYLKHDEHGNCWMEADSDVLPIDVGQCVEDFYAIARKIK